MAYENIPLTAHRKQFMRKLLSHMKYRKREVLFCDAEDSRFDNKKGAEEP